MKTDLLKSWRLYLNIFLAIIGFSFGVWAMPEVCLVVWQKITIILVISFLLCVKEYDTLKGTAFVNRTRAIIDILAEVDGLNPQLSSRQRLRSSVFVESGGNAGRIYVMEQHYNMGNDADKRLEIPQNMGVTGAVCTEKRQIFGDYHDIYGEGKYRISGEQYKLVAKDLKWICGTPIVSGKRGRVRVVLDIDGDKELSIEDKQKVLSFSQAMAGKLAKYY